MPPTQTHDAKQTYKVWELHRELMKDEAIPKPVADLHLKYSQHLYNLIPKSDRDIPEPE